MNMQRRRIRKILSFNRYMVECEFCFLMNEKHIARVLIDTWWNVNYNNVRAVEMVKAVLIDTWWNVNLNCVV